MVDKVLITKELRDYIELLHYEQFRYRDLLACINRDFCPMTDEEWDSSHSYFMKLYQEAKIKYRCMLNEVNEIYKDQIAGRSWFVDFYDCSIKFPPDTHKLPTVDEREQYSDQMARLYPKEDNGDIDPLKINGYNCKTVTLQVTDNCNLACTYCYQHNKGCHSMPFENAKKFVDMLLDADEKTNTYITTTNCNGIVFDFIGGEPWLEIDLISKVSKYIIGELFRRKHPLAIKFMFCICSNGVLHFDERVQEYLKFHKGHMHYNISIDGDKELHDSCRVFHNGEGSYDKAMAGVNHYRDVLKGEMGSKMTIAPANVKHVGRAVKGMLDNGYRHIHLNCVYEEGWNNEHAKELYWQLHYLVDHIVDNNMQDDVSFSILSEDDCRPLSSGDNDNNWCGGLGLMLAVDYKGDMYPCLRYMESSVGNDKEPYIIGNINDGLNVLPEHRERVSCMSFITRSSQSTEECLNCPIATGCGWCSAYNYECFGTQNKRATFICCMHKARSLATYYYMKRKGKGDAVLYCPKDWAIEIIGEEEYDKLISM